MTKIKAEDAMFVVLDWLEPGKDQPRFVTVVTGAEATDANPIRVVGVYESADEAYQATKALNEAHGQESEAVPGTEEEEAEEPKAKGKAVQAKGKAKGKTADKGKRK